MKKINTANIYIGFYLCITLLYNIPPIISPFFFNDERLFLSSESMSQDLAVEYFLLLMLYVVLVFIFSKIFTKKYYVSVVQESCVTDVSNVTFLMVILNFIICLTSVVFFGVDKYLEGYNTDPFGPADSLINIIYFSSEFLLGFCALVYSNGVVKSRRIVGLAAFVFGCLIFLVRMKRLELLVIVVSVLMLKKFRNQKLNYNLIFISLLVFSLVGAVRVEFHDYDVMIKNTFYSFITEANYSSNSVFVYLASFDHYSKYNEYFVRLLYLPISFFPQILLPFDKSILLMPFSPDLPFEELVLLSPGGASKIISTFLFQGGYIGVLFGAVIVGLLIRLYVYLTWKFSKNYAVVCALLLSFNSFALHGMRDSFFLAIKLQFQFLFVFIVIYYFSKLIRGTR